MEPVKNSGTLAETSCPRLLAYLHKTRFDGTLRISRGALLKLLYFQGGEIAMASSNDQGDHLAPILIRAGKLKPEQMDLARKSTKAGTSLARVLVQMGFLTSGELFAGARQQLRQIVGSVLGMTDASYELQAGYFPREITSLNVDTREMFLDLIRDLSDRSFVLLEVGSPDTIYSPVKDSGNGGDTPRLPRAWKNFAERFSTPLAIHDFGQAASLDDFTASKVVYGLSLLGCLTQERQGEPATQTIPIHQAADDHGGEASAEAMPISIPIHADQGGGLSSPAAAVETAPMELSANSPNVHEESAVEPIPTFRERFHHGKPPAPPSESIPETVEPPVEANQEERPEPSPSRAGRVEGETPLEPERVARNAPIRLEFKGPYASQLPPVKPSRPWAAASIIGGLCLLALTSYWFIFLRGPAKGSAGAAPEPIPTQESAPVDGGLEKSSTGESVPGSDAATPSEVPAQESTSPAPEAQPPSDSSAASGSLTESQESNESARTGGGPEAPPSRPPEPASPTSGFGAARAHFDAGEFSSAARGWAETLREGGASAFTLQIAIACQEGTLQKIAQRTEGSDRFFVLPFTLQGRSCYRLCWGTYASLETAQAARSTIPSFFLDEGGHPVVVSLQKSLPQEGR